MSGDQHRAQGAEPSEERPVYRKVRQNAGVIDTGRYMVVCDEGWRLSIVCESMYEWAADWLIKQIQGKPYVPGRGTT